MLYHREKKGVFKTERALTYLKILLNWNVCELHASNLRFFQRVHLVQFLTWQQSIQTFRTHTDVYSCPVLTLNSFHISFKVPSVYHTSDANVQQIYTVE